MLLPTPRPTTDTRPTIDSRSTIDTRTTIERPERRRAGAALLDGPPDTAPLRPLLHEAARLDLDDRDGWETLHASARPHLAALIEAGRLPTNLALDAATPPVVTARTLAVAWRRLTADGRTGR